MEAIRALQRQKEAQSKGGAPVSSSVCEIVDYVTENFRSDGDLDAQVRTALKRTCNQGFVKYERNDAYRLVDPLVCQMMKTQQANSATSMSSLTARRCIHDPCQQQNETPRNRNGCGDSDQVQDSSDNELSLPSSAADDILWRRMQNQQNQNNSAGDQTCPPPNPGACNQNRNQNPCASHQNRNQNPCASNQNRNQDPCASNQNRNQDPCASNQNRNQDPCSSNQNRNQCRGVCCPCNPQGNQSSAANNGAASRVMTPAGELDVTFSNGEDDDDDEESGEENGERNGANEDVEQDEDEDEEEEEGEEESEGEEDETQMGGGDAASDDSALQELNVRNRRPKNEVRDRELKRWIRQCRKECERQAQQRRAR